MTSKGNATSFAATVFDYIIVGGGTAGLTIAARLTENPSVTVGVLEAGLDRTEDPKVLTPGFAPSMWGDPEYDWVFKTVPQIHGNNRIVAHPRGKQLGGSSAINFDVWTHASQQDINDWGKLGNKGWSWDELFPYFLKSETYNAPPLKTSEQIDTTFIVPSFHGEAGPVQDSFPPFYDNFYKAWEPTYTNLGLGPTGDPKGGIAIGAYAILLTIEPKNASRSFAGTAYYKPNAARKNLQVLTGALVTKVMFAPAKEPLIATGVSFTVDGGSYTVSASKEIILCAGAFQSPQLLELSGIGNAELLESKRIEVLYNNPNVGENLQDHVYVPLGFEAASGEATFESLRDQAVLAETIAEYTINHTGPLAAGTSNAYVSLSQILDALGKGEQSVCRGTSTYFAFPAHISSGPIPQGLLDAATSSTTSDQLQQSQIILQKLLDPTEASTQEIFLPGGLAPEFVSNASALFTPDPTTYPGNYFSMLAVLEHPFSHGSVHITSSDPTVHPAVDPNYFSHPLDLFVISQAVLHIQQVARTEPLSMHLKDSGYVFQPGFYELNDANVEAFVKNTFTSEYHPMGTCAMGLRDQGGVVDERMLVHGTSNLRVVDASVFPLQVKGNLVSLVYAVAERAADFIKAEQ